VDLRLDRGRVADLVDRVERLVDGRREPGVRYRDPGVGEDSLRLMFV